MEEHLKADIIKIKMMARQKKGHPLSFPCSCTSCECLNSKMAAFCTQCGEPLDVFEEKTKYKCGECEFIVGENDKFCEQCGESLTDNGVTVYIDNHVEITEVEFNKVKKEKNGKKAGPPMKKIVTKRCLDIL